MCIITVTRLGTSPGYRFGKLHTKGWWLGSQTIKSLTHYNMTFTPASRPLPHPLQLTWHFNTP